ncbi:MAG: tRNA (adenosine(37)-N6)-threonylcarbamoyltransferase complex dimerization subunit type 1 TsaB [Candidatus Saccharimonadales bacterium]
MLILTIRTDKPEAEIGIFQDGAKLGYKSWPAHRHLAETIHLEIKKLLAGHGKDWPDIEGIVCFEGPGSFTGLRIGLAVANSLAYGLQVPIVGSRGDDWLADGIDELKQGQNQLIIKPRYGAEAHITQARK